MQVEYYEAKKAFNRIDIKLKCPSQDPDYVMIDANREHGLVPTFFVYEDNEGTYYHAFHVSTIPSTVYKDIQTPYGYGGPIATTNNPDFLERAWNSYYEWAKETKIVAEFIRFHPMLENWRSYYGEVIQDRETVWIDLSVENISSQYQTRAKRKIRKAINNELEIHWTSHEEFFKYFPSVYKEVMDSLEADSFYYFPEVYYNAWKHANNVHFALCKKAEQVVATIFFYHNSSLMEYHLSASTEQGKELAATPLIIHEAALMGKRLGYKQLHLGGGTSNLINDPLFFFKSGFSYKRGDFRIGKMIHLPDVYIEMKEEWLKKNGAISNRILFYRS